MQHKRNTQNKLYYFHWRMLRGVLRLALFRNVKSWLKRGSGLVGCGNPVHVFWDLKGKPWSPWTPWPPHGSGYDYF